MRYLHFLVLAVLASALGLAEDGTDLLQPAFQAYSSATPRSSKIDQLNRAGALYVGSSILSKRADGDGTCGPGRPCTTGCCSKNGYCGFGPDFCGSGNCTSTCDAKAQCGKYAADSSKKCALNVCCSQYGFCGTTSSFCGTGCDPSGGLCGPPPGPTGKSPTLFRSIGYYESWSNGRPCDRVNPEDLDTSGLTHINFAFAFFDPTTFRVMAMDKNADALLKRFTALKTNRLQTWISIGGWTFNDPGNSPERAFSNMVAYWQTRRIFINSLVSFMQTYGFDGVDIDWEYPGADDRGGRPSDSYNFVLLLKEMQTIFDGRYAFRFGWNATLRLLVQYHEVSVRPSDKSYDLHGVWDASNKWTGPIVRPHTNLTEIDDALSLLWRVGVKASNVVLGLGFYGRSFTLSDSNCKTPNNCRFSSGGNKGECSGEPGILTASEIGRIISNNNLTPTMDTKAAVKWISWAGNQWVSYDDEDTFQLKMDYARSVGLSGIMVWALDQGVFESQRSSSTLGQIRNRRNLGLRGITPQMIADVERQADAADSCYLSFCGRDCEPGYTSVTQSTGQVGQLGPSSECQGGARQNLCCRSPVSPGICAWFGYRGVGLSCYGGCPDGSILLATNTQSLGSYKSGPMEMKCNGGSQSFCCNGFQAPPITSRPNVLDPEEVDNDPNSISKRDLRTCATVALLTAGVISAFAGPAGILWGATASLVCLISENEASIRKVAGYSGPLTRGQKAAAAAIAAGALPPPFNPKPKAPPKSSSGTSGRYTLLNTTGMTTCSTTYVCEYGLGFDQICDNQRYGLDKITPGTNVFHYDSSGGPRNQRSKSRWAGQHHSNYRSTFGLPPTGRRRCEVDEFPLNSMLESANWAPQALRLVDGNENGAAGNDWQAWLVATWWPCSTLLGAPPPVTYMVPTATLPANDPRVASPTASVIAKYGFDSTSQRLPCFATYVNGQQVSSAIPDHGFRVAVDDPLFSPAVNWPEQDYSADPNLMQASNRPTSVASAHLLKRDSAATAFAAQETHVPPPLASADPVRLEILPETLAAVTALPKM